MTIDQLESEAPKLPHHERVRPAQRLLASFDEDAELEQVWHEEAERRLAKLESGEAAEIPADEVFASLSAGLRYRGPRIHIGA